jgi:hypothetical protein
VKQARNGHTRTPVKYCPFLASPPPLPSPVEGEGVCPYWLSERFLTDVLELLTHANPANNTLAAWRLAALNSSVNQP